MHRPLTIPTHRRPTLPGSILLHEFLEPLGITQTAFAKHIGVTNARLSEIIHGKRPVTMDAALRFERALGFSAESWMRMQLTVDMYDALHGRAAKSVSRITPIARIVAGFEPVASRCHPEQSAEGASSRDRGTHDL